MNVSGVNQPGQNSLDLKDKRASEGNENMFASLLKSEQGGMGAHKSQYHGGDEAKGAGEGQNSEQADNEALPFTGNPVVDYLPPAFGGSEGAAPTETDIGEGIPTADEPIQADIPSRTSANVTILREEADGLRDQADGLRDQADGLRDQADGLRDQADALISADGASPGDAVAAQSLRSAAGVLDDGAATLDNNAVALDQRAIAVDQRADTVEERQAIAIAAGLSDGVQDGPTPRPVDVPAVEGFGSEANVESFETALNAIPEYAELDVVATREATGSEVDLLLDLAEEAGASPEDLELIADFAHAFPVQFVFVDGLDSSFGFEAAAGGELAVENTSTILLDASFTDDDFTLEGPSLGGADTGEAALEAVEFAFSSILEIFDLPGKASNTADIPLEIGALPTGEVPNIAYEGSDAFVLGNQVDSVVDGLSASQVVGGTEDLDGEE
jgi:hypothetical protein